MSGEQLGIEKIVEKTSEIQQTGNRAINECARQLVTGLGE